MAQPHIPSAHERRSLLREFSASPQIGLLGKRELEGRCRPPWHPDAMSRPYLDHALIVGITNIPDASELEVVKAAFPAAADVLDRWLANWTMIKENNPRNPHLWRERSPATHLAYKTEIAARAERRAKFDAAIDGVYIGRDGMRRLLHADYYERHLQGRQRNFLHHYVDDAFSFFSLGSAQPGMAVLWTPIPNLILRYTGMDEDGFLTFLPLGHYDREKIKTLVKQRHEDDGKYWQWEPIRKGMRRYSEEADDHLGAADILLDMAERGHRRAFVKSVRSKGGTWTVDLTGVQTREDALRNLIRDGFDSSENFRYGLIVQEHLPTTREQRFFVTNGRIVASVCSDRNLNGTDIREGRFFDERVAIIERPEVEGGEFDRGQTAHEVNRPLAAAFAREARKIVREMRAEGRMHFVVDMGLTERGVVAIEINSFFRSGPYCLDRRRVAAAHKRSLSAEMLAAAEANLANIRRNLEGRKRIEQHDTQAFHPNELRQDTYDFHDRTPPETSVADTVLSWVDEPETPVDSVQKTLEALNFDPAIDASLDEHAETFVDLDRVRERETHDMAARTATNRSVGETLEALDFTPRKPDPKERLSGSDRGYDAQVTDRSADPLSSPEFSGEKSDARRKPAIIQTYEDVQAIRHEPRSVRAVAEEEG
ncbi:ATP-grasp domain-containing protein [Rhizobium sp. BK176]|uniref:ATP-grasp domain-containing protein n=1 Tax=Rhizobium sp. BK176 TaxID=2587071 RepID=UPI002168CABB|nr:ATP-grasp domain-containing protein [Rhizobium sp. BK176]MCS4089386.1 hypothetical protein [Rhizobium sp. BK176]